MAAFGIPMAHDDDEDGAVRAAIAMITDLWEWNKVREARGEAAIDHGVGLNTGMIVSGNIGSPKRMDYTVIGDTVNLSARLESATKYYGVSVLVSEFTVAASHEQHQFRELDQIVVQGKSKPVAVFEALGHHDETTFANMQNTLAAFEQGLRQYRQRDWDGALNEFERALSLRPDDRPSALYTERCRHYRDNPPEDEWAGVWEMTDK